MLFRRLLKHAIRDGSVRVIEADGSVHRFGSGPASSTIRLHRRDLSRKLSLNPPLAFGEGYMEGQITVEDGSLYDFLEVIARNYVHLESHWLVAIGLALSRHVRWLKQYNPIPVARRNVAHHYDLSDRLYDLFLDRDRQYSCAYFTSPEVDLEQAQRDKMRHIAAKLLLDRPGLSLLDIGSGWGGLGLYLAEAGGCRVTGVTLSEEQHRFSSQRARESGLGERVQFHLRDYREDAGHYDRIVSVGMFEHVGKKNYDEFFRKVRDLLCDDGVFLLHSIGRFDDPGPVNPFMRKYIFPGSDVPTLSEVLPAVERTHLLVTDIEVLRLHYAETLRHWHQRFQANRAKIAELYDERFCRMWELYLIGSELGFRHQGLMVFQMQIAKRQDALPLTRDYIHDWERERGAARAQAAE